MLKFKDGLKPGRTYFIDIQQTTPQRIINVPRPSREDQSQVNARESIWDDFSIADVKCDYHNIKQITDSKSLKNISGCELSRGGVTPPLYYSCGNNTTGMCASTVICKNTENSPITTKSNIVIYCKPNDGKCPQESIDLDKCLKENVKSFTVEF